MLLSEETNIVAAAIAESPETQEQNFLSIQLEIDSLQEETEAGMEKEWLFRLLVTETGHTLDHVPPHSDVCSAESCCGCMCCVWLISLVVIRMSGLST